MEYLGSGHPHASNQVPPDQTLFVRIGTEVVDGATNVSVTSAINSPTTATADVASSRLTASADYRALSRWTIGDDVLFAGWVRRAVADADQLHLEFANGMPLDEGRIERLTVIGTPPEEMAWTVARMAGFGEAQLLIEGFHRVLDRFHVVMPIDGVGPEIGLNRDHVRIVRDAAPISTALGFVSDEAWKSSFLASGAWAIASTEAGTLFDAERRGVQMIEASLDRLALESQYSGAVDPDGNGVDYSRDDLRALPTARRVALAKAVAGRRAWLRELDESSRPIPMRRRRANVSVPLLVNKRFDEGVRAWRRAIETHDRVAAVTSLWEAIEFFVAETAVPRIFEKHDLRRVRTALSSVEMSDEQRARLLHVLSRLNDAPLLIQLRHALASDGVPFNEDEIDALGRLRSRRNDFVHGRSREEPAEADLDVGKAFVNRLLIYWSRSPRVVSASQPEV